MSTKDVAFIANILVVKYKAINQMLGGFVLNGTDFSYSDGKNKLTKIKIGYLDDGRFAHVIIEDGVSMPRHDKVYNVVTLEERDNPRKDDEIEAKVSYALIDTKSSLLWISNYKKKSILLDFLMKNFNTPEVELKNIYNEKEFVDTLNIVSSISVSAEPNIFIEHNLSTNLINDPLGYGAEIATINFQYKHKKVFDKLKSEIDKLVDKRDSFKRIVVTGRDRNDIGMTFNTSVFSRRIEFRSSIDDNGMFISDELFKNLIEHIKDEEKRLQNI